MPYMGNVHATGESGRDYMFEAYTRETTFNDVGAVYVFTRTVTNSQGKTIHSTIYVGKTAQLNTRLADHHQQDCIDTEGANAICVLAVSNEQERAEIEADLIATYQPQCNVQLKYAKQRP